MSFIKHVGKHNSKKVVILWREVPGAEDMCLVTYSEVLPREYHDGLMSALESDAGQKSKEFNEVLHRTLMHDGRNLLSTLHAEGWIKKVPANQVIVTPTPTSNVRLDELNDILKKMAAGEEAVKRMAELDSQRGIRDPAKKGVESAVTSVLEDSALAQQRLDQASKMRAEAQGLLNEATRLEKEAAQFTKPKKNAQKKKASTATA